MLSILSNVIFLILKCNEAVKSFTYSGLGGSLANKVPSFLKLFPPASSRSSSLSLSIDRA